MKRTSDDDDVLTTLKSTLSQMLTYSERRRQLLCSTHRELLDAPASWMPAANLCNYVHPCVLCVPRHSLDVFLSSTICESVTLCSMLSGGVSTLIYTSYTHIHQCTTVEFAIVVLHNLLTQAICGPTICFLYTKSCNSDSLFDRKTSFSLLLQDTSL